jgi:hypothetical protein
MIFEKYKVYHWKEEHSDGEILEDVVFTVGIDKTSSPHVLQIRSLQLRSIKSDMVEGRFYPYKYYYNNNSITYTIKEITPTDAEKAMIFDEVFKGLIG